MFRRLFCCRMLQLAIDWIAIVLYPVLRAVICEDLFEDLRKVTRNTLEMM